MPVQTSKISPSELGRTLTHEHLSMDFSHFYKRPPKHLDFAYNGDITLQNVGYLRQYPYSSKYNLLLNDGDTEKVVIEELKDYKKFGGGTIVENSTEGLKRNIGFFKRVSEETDVHVIVGSGFYINDMQDEAKNYKQKEMYTHMLEELTIGCKDDLNVKAGFLGEIASVWPITDFEKKAIRAAGEVQAQIGCGVSFHPHREPKAPFEIIRLYLEAGGKKDKAVMSHLDRTLLNIDTLLEFAELGVYCQYDLFGIEVSYYQLNEATDMPSDSQRIDKLKVLVQEGYEDMILMSHDIHTKHRLTRFGGHGYAHILNNVLPRMKCKGFSQEVIDKITIHNPAKWLDF